MNNNYGYKLTAEEFQHKIFESLKRNNTSTDSGMDKFNKEELNITIDYRLGVDYPQEKRQLLQDLRSKSQKHLLKLMVIYNICHIFPTSLHEKILNKVIQKMLGRANNFMSKKEIKEMFLD